MSTHEITAADLGWPDLCFADADEAYAHLKLINEELREIAGDPLQAARYRELDAAAGELSSLIFQSELGLI